MAQPVLLLQRTRVPIFWTNLKLKFSCADTAFSWSAVTDDSMCEPEVEEHALIEGGVENVPLTAELHEGGVVAE